MDEVNQQGTTIILTTHYLEEAESMCKNVAIIDEGKIIENTSMVSLLNRLNSETFVFYLDKEIDSAPELKCTDQVLLRDGNTLEIELDDTQPLNQLIMELDNLGLIVKSMRNKVNRLEELFIKLTSKSGEKSSGLQP